jgi:Clp amino terminal domain, pathogenicity island component
MSPTLRKKVTFRNSREIARLAEGETPPASGWAVGSGGAYEDGKLAGLNAQLRPGVPRLAREEVVWTPTEILIYDDAGTTDGDGPEGHRVNWFSGRARRLVALANHEAHQVCWPCIGSEHLLLGLLHEDENLGARALSAVGVQLEAARGEMLRRITYVEGADPTDDRIALPFTPEAENVVQGARRQASRHGQGFVWPEHLLLAIIENGTGLAWTILRALGVEFEDLSMRIENLIGP